MTGIAVGLIAAGAVVFVLAAVASRSLRSGIPLMLDLWLAAGLLRVTEQGSWSRIAAAAALILVRKLVIAFGMPGTASSWTSPQADPNPTTETP
jgi:hypothetical protein